MIQEVLQICHDSLEGGHQGIARTFYRIPQTMYALVPTVARVIADRSFAGTYLATFWQGDYFKSMDFAIPLPKSRRGSLALLLFQCAFTGPVMGNAMANATALRVAQVFEECVYRRFGALSLIRHDRDPRLTSEVFTEMMQSSARATLRYRPQANDQQERSVKTVMPSVRVYDEDRLPQDWDDTTEKLIFAINNSIDATRRETPFYLVHGWDAQSTLKAMSSSLQ
ncbi:reverse transcriptase [Phytophthora megakarya]|uniref:Reverse transcriptase n=1 Tax=Phytophthora megakarya TaxID=4795 RepID=A0A225VQV5_9STRA|nr:reverse transcriptase [Phytophthora megakarya]